jgi:dolichol-phosphate mannosyltransferase
MLEILEEGTHTKPAQLSTLKDPPIDIVYARRAKRAGESIFKKFSAYFFYRMLDKQLDFTLPPDTGDFRLITRKVADIILKANDPALFLRGAVSWTGLQAREIVFDREERWAGKSKYSISKMFRLASDALFSFVNRPFYFIIKMGLFALVTSLVLALGFSYFHTSDSKGLWMIYVEISSIFFIAFVVIILGIVGGYVHNSYKILQGYPRYVVSEVIDVRE